MKKNSASTIFFDKFCDLILCITAKYDLCGSIIREILHDVTVCLCKYTNNHTFFQKKLCGASPSYQKCTTDAILTINAGFARYMGEDAAQGEKLPIGIKVNTVNGTRGSILTIMLFTLAHIVVMASFGLLVSNFTCLAGLGLMTTFCAIKSYMKTN